MREIECIPNRSIVDETQAVSRRSGTYTSSYDGITQVSVAGLTRSVREAREPIQSRVVRQTVRVGTVTRSGIVERYTFPHHRHGVVYVEKGDIVRSARLEVARANQRVTRTCGKCCKSSLNSICVPTIVAHPIGRTVRCAPEVSHRCHQVHEATTAGHGVDKCIEGCIVVEGERLREAKVVHISTDHLIVGTRRI